MDKKELKEVQEKWTKVKNYSLSRLGKYFRDKKKSSSRIDSKDIRKWLENPQKYQPEIIDLSDTLYAPEGIYKTLVNLIVNMATLDNYTDPSFFTMQTLLGKLKDKDDNAREKILAGFNSDFSEIKKYVSDINIKKTGRRMIESLVRYGVYCGYEKNDGTIPYLWDLPVKYIHLYSVKNGQYTVEFNFKYFDELQRDKELQEFAWELYPKEFEQLYLKYKQNNDNFKYPEWQKLPSEKVCCIKLDGDSDAFFIPLFTPLFNELFQLTDLVGEEIETSRDEKVKLVHQKLPIDKETGIPLLSPEEGQKWQAVLEYGLPETVSSITSPFDLKEIPFKSVQDKKTELVEFAKSMAYMESGVNPLLVGGSSTNSSVGIAQNLIYLQSLVFIMIEKIQSWFNYRLSSMSKIKYNFKLKILKVTWFNQKEAFEREYKLASVGGSITVLSAIANHNPDDYNALLQYENLMGMKDNWIPLKNMNQMSSNENEVGAPQKSIDELGENGTKTRDIEGNVR